MKIYIECKCGRMFYSTKNYECGICRGKFDKNFTQIKADLMAIRLPKNDCA